MISTKKKFEKMTILDDKNLNLNKINFILSSIMMFGVQVSACVFADSFYRVFEFRVFSTI